MIPDYETIVREIILNSQIPKITLHENHHLYHNDLETQLDAFRPSKKKSFVNGQDCLFLHLPERSGGVDCLGKPHSEWGGWSQVGMLGSTPKNIWMFPKIGVPPNHPF